MSKPSITEYHRPTTIEEAWQRVSPGDPAVRVLSGGADLTIHAPSHITTLVDVSRVLDDSIEVADDGTIRIGAMTTLTDVMEHPEVSRYAAGVVPEMMVHVGNPLLRNFSTLGGHVARGKLSDAIPVLLALDAEVSIYQGGETRLSLADYYEGRHHSDPHILTNLWLDRPADRSAAAFLRFARTAFDFPLLNACARVDLDGDEVAEVRIVCGATPRRSHRANEAESAIREDGLTHAGIDHAARLAREEVPTGSGWVASAEYRSQLVEVLTKRCLTKAAERLEVA